MSTSIMRSNTSYHIKALIAEVLIGVCSYLDGHIYMLVMDLADTEGLGLGANRNWASLEIELQGPLEDSASEDHPV
jgi:hypothetical protein